MRKNTILHPLALAIFFASIALAGVAAFTSPWSERWAWLVGWGVLAYVCMAAVHLRKTRPPTSTLTTEPVPQDNMAVVTEEALRRLNNPAALASCQLIARIPNTVAAARKTGMPSQVRPLDQAQALRNILISAIERLRNAENTPAGIEILHYSILQEEYVLGRPNTQVMMAHSISESTLYRYRRDAIRILGQDLAKGEELLSGD